MRRTALFLLLSLTLTACGLNKKTKPHFKSIDFSYFDISPLAFRLKIFNQDSVFLRQNFAYELRNDTTYHTVLTGRLKQQLDSLMAVINFSKLDSVYETGHFDGDGYRLYIEDDTLKRQFRVHSVSPPKELEALKELFLKIRTSFLPLDTTTQIRINPPKTQNIGNPRIFALKDINSDKYYLADSIKKIFQRGYIGESPLIAIDGMVFNYQQSLDTIILPLQKSEITVVSFLDKKSSSVIYGAKAISGAVIINTIALRNSKDNLRDPGQKKK